MEEQNKKSTFYQEYKWWIIVPVFILIIAYIIIYACFRGNGIISAGIDLEKKDWLSFLGSYLSFSGTLVISLIAILQVKFFEDREKNRMAIERKKAIQPILSISFELNKQLGGTMESFNRSDPKTYPQHKNVIFTITNAGKYPICNVIVFDEYLWQILMPGEKEILQAAFQDSPDTQKSREGLIVLSSTIVERTEEGIPRSFTIRYDDIDGNEMSQTFELKTLGEKFYYSLRGPEKK